MLAGVGCSTPASTGQCTDDKQCDSGWECKQGTCTPKNALACDSDSQCKDALSGGSWKPGEVTPCNQAKCVQKFCQLVNQEVGASCEDGDDLDCQMGTCTKEGKCTPKQKIADGKCLILGKCYANGDHDKAEPANGDCTICDAAKDQKAWSAAPEGTPCADEPKNCTVDKCVGMICNHDTTIPKTCVIDGQCYDEGTANPTNPCEVCDAKTPKAWSPAAKGTACKLDDLPCTLDACDGKGACDTGELAAKTCLIQDGGKPRCMAEGETLSAKDSCQVCDSAKNAKAVSPLSDGASCAPGLPCLAGQCKSGVCENQGPKPGACLIGDKCFQNTDLDPANPCQGCDSKQSQIQWTALPDTASCTTDEVECTTDHCSGGGACLHDLNHAVCAGKSGPCADGVCDPKSSCIAVPKDVTVVCQGEDKVACTVEHCDGTGGCAKTGTATNTLCDDKEPCTLDVCTATGCSHTNQDSVCDDGNDCTDDKCLGDKGCALTNKTDGTACKSDGIACTTEGCVAGSCKASINASFCLVGADQSCIKAGDKSAAGCLVCDPSVKNTDWTLVADKAACDSDSEPCTDDQCAAGTCKHLPNTLPCTDDSVACTDDICGGGTCQHSANAAKCDDGVACTDNKCDVQKGCVYTDSCPWGHACDKTLQACLSEGGNPVELQKASADDPNPTNAALGRHTLSSGGERTWVLWQSDSCMSVVSGAWKVSGGASLRAMALDPQVAAVGQKAKPAVFTLPASSFWAGSKTVCQAFPTVVSDPQAAGQVWVSWLEADPAGGAPKCLDQAGKGGILRLARLDGKTAGGAMDVGGDVCTAGTGIGPLFLSTGVALLDGVGGDVNDVAKRGLLQVRPQGTGLADWATSFGFKGKAIGDSSAPGSLIGQFAKVHPVVVDLGSKATASARFLALAATSKNGAFGLWAYMLTDKGVDNDLDAWAASTKVKDVFAGATDVCGLDAAVDADGKLGVVVVTRKAGLDRVEVISRAVDGTTSVVTVKQQASLGGGDCRLGVAGARISAMPSGWLTATYTTSSPTAPGTGNLEVQFAMNATPAPVGALFASTMDTTASLTPTGALAWRGLTRTVAAGPTASTTIEAIDISGIRRLLLWTWKP